MKIPITCNEERRRHDESKKSCNKETSQEDEKEQKNGKEKIVQVENRNSVPAIRKDKV